MTARTPSLFHHAIRGILLSSAGDFVLKIFGLFATAIVLNQIAPYEYGLWQLLLSAVIAFDMFLFPSISGMLVADASREYGAGRAAFGNAVLARGVIMFGILGLIAGGALFVSAPVLTALSGLQLTEYLRLLSVTLLFSGLSQAYVGTLQARLEFSHVQTFKVLGRFSYFAGVVLLVFAWQWGVMGVVWSYTVSLGVPILLYTPYLLSILRTFWGNIDIVGWGVFFSSHVWQGGRWLVASDIIGAANASLWPWLVGYFLGVDTLGIISVALMLLSQVSAFIPITAVLRSVLPRTAETPERLHAWITRSMKFGLWANVAGGVAAFFVLQLIFPLFFVQYLAVLPLFAVLLITLPLRALSAAATEWFYAMRMQGSLFFASTVPKTFMLVLLPLMLWPFGLVGYIAWYIISADVVLFARLMFIAKQSGRRIRISEILWPDRQDDEIIARIYKGISLRVKGLLVT